MLDLPIVLFDDASECCGCGACSCICPQQAISMRADESGFVFPVIDEDKCVQCGLCTETCAFQTQAIPNELQEV